MLAAPFFAKYVRPDCAGMSGYIDRKAPAFVALLGEVRRERKLRRHPMTVAVGMAFVLFHKEPASLTSLIHIFSPVGGGGEG